MTEPKGLLYYDYLLLLSAEIRLVWQSKWSAANILYYWIRLGFLVDITLILITYPRTSATSQLASSATRSVCTNNQVAIDNGA